MTFKFIRESYKPIDLNEKTTVYSLFNNPETAIKGKEIPFGDISIAKGVSRIITGAKVLFIGTAAELQELIENA